VAYASVSYFVRSGSVWSRKPGRRSGGCGAVAAAPKSGTLLLSNDGKRIGRIARILRDKAGTPLSAAVIYDSRFVYVPVTTVTLNADGDAVTSLSRKEVAALR
jgi:hypothetical protein